jgi:flavin-binding protein dodecin
MADPVYKTIEITGTSKKSMEEAVNNAVVRASKTLHNLRWFEVLQVRGNIDKGKVSQWQVTAKIGFHLD